jgi:hypothetical protein
VSTYRASVRVENGTLYTARPVTAGAAVGELLDHAVLVASQAAGEVLTIDVTVETAEDSGTPLADGVVGTSSAPLPGGRRAEDDVDPDDGTPYLTEPASLADDGGELDQPAPGPAVAGQQ